MQPPRQALDQTAAHRAPPTPPYASEDAQPSTQFSQLLRGGTFLSFLFFFLPAR